MGSKTRNFRGGRKKRTESEDPASILDIIKRYYPDRFGVLGENMDRMEGRFSEDEWKDILTRARESFGNRIGELKKTRLK